MKFDVEIEDALWEKATKAMTFKTPEETLKHLIVMSLYGTNSDSIGSQLILLTDKVKVTCPSGFRGT